MGKAVRNRNTEESEGYGVNPNRVPYDPAFKAIRPLVVERDGEPARAAPRKSPEMP
jgi:hypothetical protein